MFTGEVAGALRNQAKLTGNDLIDGDTRAGFIFIRMPNGSVGAFSAPWTFVGAPKQTTSTQGETFNIGKMLGNDIKFSKRD